MRNAILYIVIISVYSCDIFRDAEDMGIYPVNYKILSLGDSYTIGQSVCDECNFPMQLKDSLQNTLSLDSVNVEIIAVTGWTTTALINSVDPVLENNSPDNIFKENDLVTLLIGVNNQYQNRPFELYENERVNPNYCNQGGFGSILKTDLNQGCYNSLLTCNI
jgi:lysophospholipase L1-like esterase